MYTLLGAAGAGFLWEDPEKPQRSPGSRIRISPPDIGKDAMDPQFIVINLLECITEGRIYFRKIRFRVAPIWQLEGKTDQFAVVYIDTTAPEPFGETMLKDPVTTKEEFQAFLPILKHYCSQVIQTDINHFIFGL